MKKKKCKSAIETILQINNNHTEEREGIIKVTLENSILVRYCKTKDKKK